MAAFRCALMCSAVALCLKGAEAQPFGTPAYSTYPQSNAFDNNGHTFYLSQLFTTPSIIGYAFPEAKRLRSYTIQYSNGNLKTRSPRDFQLQGYNGNWVTLDTQSGQTIAVWDASLQRRSFLVSNTGYYTKFQLVVTDDNDARAGVVTVSVGELSFNFYPPVPGCTSYYGKFVPSGTYGFATCCSTCYCNGNHFTSPCS